MLLPMSMAASTRANHIQGDDKNAEQEASGQGGAYDYVASCQHPIVTADGGRGRSSRENSGEGTGTVGFVDYLVEFHYGVCI